MTLQAKYRRADDWTANEDDSLRETYWASPLIWQSLTMEKETINHITKQNHTVAHLQDSKRPHSGELSFSYSAIFFHLLVLLVHLGTLSLHVHS